ncbi:uncharacterized protein LOC125662145 [Ostrea edulis]|uniref:uncharacterized protein LOC125662145 n=1 Tax=Ostrea edulis TaxID=37623 RepID=UPI0024AEEFF7|nr:uncharacterized protein LOC125662145 [Ostrea edulis]
MRSTLYRLCVQLSLLMVTWLSKVDSGQTCLSCKAIPQPTECSIVTRCGEHEQCFVQKYVNNDGHVRYDLGCASNLTCHVIPTKRKLSRVSGPDTAIVCEACCNDTKVCNIQDLCGSRVLPENAGNICFSCKYQLDADGCDHIELCSRDRACYIGLAHDETSPLYHWVTGCAPRDTKCKSLLHYSDNPFCSICCDETLCNNRCQRNNTTQLVKHLFCFSTETCTDYDRFCPLLRDKCDSVPDVRAACPRTCSSCQLTITTATPITNIYSQYTPTKYTTKTPNPTHSSTTLTRNTSQHTTESINPTQSSTTLTRNTSQHTTESINPTHSSTTLTRNPPQHTTESINRTHSSMTLTRNTSQHTTESINRTRSSTTAGGNPSMHMTELSTLLSITHSQSTDNLLNGSTQGISSVYQPTNGQNSNSTTPDPSVNGCADAVNINCMKYNLFDICNRTSIYYSWGSTRCRYTCGLCHAYPCVDNPCVDTITNCDEYEQALCTDHTFSSFVYRHCRKFCQIC